MVETVEDIVKDALSEITAYGAEASILAADAQLGVRYLNRMMAALDADGIDLGYTIASSLGDEVTVPDGAIEAIVFNLAARLWRHFADNTPIPPDLIIKADLGLKTLERLAVNVGAAEYSETLPLGSGNMTEHTLSSQHFYPPVSSEILAETNGAISLEDNTE